MDNASHFTTTLQANSLVEGEATHSHVARRSQITSTQVIDTVEAIRVQKSGRRGGNER